MAKLFLRGRGRSCSGPLFTRFQCHHLLKFSTELSARVNESLYFLSSSFLVSSVKVLSLSLCVCLFLFRKKQKGVIFNPEHLITMKGIFWNVREEVALLPCKVDTREVTEYYFFFSSSSSSCSACSCSSSSSPSPSINWVGWKRYVKFQFDSQRE